VIDVSLCPGSVFRFIGLVVFVLDLARNGEMQSRISQLGSLSTVCAQYYAAQIVDAVDYMHSKGIIHRYVWLIDPFNFTHSKISLSDLKPENLLLDDAFRIKITDFGTGRYLEPGGMMSSLLSLLSAQLYHCRGKSKNICWYCTICFPRTARGQRNK
jgi:serine/threonine protein kinase